jgi:hypothetical protein
MLLGSSAQASNKQEKPSRAELSFSLPNCQQQFTADSLLEFQ